MTLVQRALDFATVAHGTQVRKYTNEPYINHPIAVSKIVEGIYADYSPKVRDQAIAVALLHDVVEDTPYGVAEIEASFGVQIAKMVWWLSDISKPTDGNRAFRKRLDRWHISGAPRMAQTVKLADMLDNTKSIVQYDPDFARVYLMEKHLLLKEMKGGDWTLRNECKALLKEYRDLWDR